MRQAVRTLALPALALAAVGGLASACGSAATSNDAAATSTAASTPSATARPATAAKVTITLAKGHLVDDTGRTLYLWVADKGASSTCNGACAGVWPPVASAATAGNGVVASALGTSTRSDGTTQATYHGHPLYYFEGDSAPGATVGQGSDSFGAKWWEVARSGAAITGAAAPHTAAGGSSESPSDAASPTHSATSSHTSSPSHPATHAAPTKTPKPTHAPTTKAPSSPKPPPTSAPPGGGYGY